MVGLNTSVTYFTNDWFGFEGNVATGFAPTIYDNEHVKYLGYAGGVHVGSRRARWEPWGHALFGGGHLLPQTAGNSKNSFEITAGGGVDYRVYARLSLRAEADYVYTHFFSQTQNCFQGTAGVVIPLFSIRTRDDWGIGQIGDLPKCAAWVRRAGHRLLQILPPYELAAGETSPYGARTAFGLDPIYITVEAVPDLDRVVTVAELQSRIDSKQVALANYESWLNQSQSFDSLSVRSYGSLSLSGAGDAAHVNSPLGGLGLNRWRGVLGPLRRIALLRRVNGALGSGLGDSGRGGLLRGYYLVLVVWFVSHVCSLFLYLRFA